MINSMRNKKIVFSFLICLSYYYDYHLFGMLAAQLSTYYQPATDNVMQLKNTYLISGMSIIAKTTGAIILGKMGDIHGRSSAFSVSLLAAAGASFCIAIIPSYQTIGVLSTLLLLFARMIMCFFATSSADGVRIFVYETVGTKYQGLGVGLVQCCSNGGSFLAALVALILTLNIMPAYSWKLAFVLGGTLGILIFIIYRTNITDDKNRIPEYQDDIYHKYKNYALYQIIAVYLRNFILAALVAGLLGSSIQFMLFFGTYIFKVLKYIDENTMRYYLTLAIGLQALSYILIGYIISTLGKRFILPLSTVSIAAIIILIANALHERRFIPWLYFLLMIIFPFLIITVLMTLKEAFPRAVRHRLFSSSHALGSIILSAPTPMIAITTYQFGGASMPMFYFLTIIIALALTTYLLGKRSVHSTINLNNDSILE